MTHSEAKKRVREIIAGERTAAMEGNAYLDDKDVDALECVLAGEPSDEYHPVLGFDGEAYDTIDGVIRNMRGFGVTLTLEDDTEVEAVLSQPVYNEENDRLDIEFYRVEDGEYLVIDSVPAKKLERAFVRRIQVS